MTTDNHFKIIVPSYNNEKWLHACLKSVQLQTYDNYQCIIIDDCSTDSSSEIIEREIDKNSKFVFIKNDERKLALRNIYEAIEHSSPDNEDVIITLDGDDWFATKNVLEILNNKYKETDSWMTYGSYMEYPSRNRGKFSREIPKEIIESNTFRESEWMSSHMRTFKYKLWKEINHDDLKDDNGNYYTMAYDQAIMLPILELASERSRFISDVLHVYNKENPISVDKTKALEQKRTAEEIRQKKRYERI